MPSYDLPKAGFVLLHRILQDLGGWSNRISVRLRRGPGKNAKN